MHIICNCLVQAAEFQHPVQISRIRSICAGSPACEGSGCCRGHPRRVLFHCCISFSKLIDLVSVTGKAAQELRKLTHSAYLSRRSSVGVTAHPHALASPLQSHDAHAETSVMREVSESLPGFSGTVLVDVTALDAVSSVSRKHGMVTSTCTRDTEGRIHVIISQERFDGFLCELEVVTGMDFSLLRDDMPSASAHAGELAHVLEVSSPRCFC